MENKQVFIGKVHIKIHKAEQKGGYSCSLRISRNEEFIWQKSYSKQNHMSYLTWRKLTYMNRNWAGKLQVTVLFTCIFWKKIVSAHFQSLFGRSNPDALWENEGKVHERECAEAATRGVL